jgi:hypothetical protein
MNGWPKRTTEADDEPALGITDIDTLERFPLVWCDTCEKTQPMIFDVMQANDKNDQDAADIICAMISDLNQSLKAQCAEQRERCLHTSAALYIWLRTLKQIRIVFVILPIVLAGFASWNFLSSETSDPVLAALFTLTAGIFPAVYSALKLDDYLQMVATLAGEYKNLEIVFGTLENVSSLKPFREFEAEFNQAVERLQAANAHAYPAPEWCFKRARDRIKTGHYSFESGLGPGR